MASIVIAGGGTGGHVYPALAIAEALVRRGHARSSIQFVGSKRALEADVVPEAGYQITLLPGRGIKRRLSTDNIGAVVGLISACVRATAILARDRPRIVVSVGGYAAVPASVAAVVLRIPLVIAESNAVPGAANRLVARMAAASAVAWPETPLPRATITGNPVRPEILAIDRSPGARRKAKQELGFDPDVQLVGAFGGSLGATSINKAMIELADRWADRVDVAIYSVVGKRDWSEVSKHERADVTLAFKQVEYQDDMAKLFEAADVLVCRSGATTSAEMAAAAVPSVLVPLPGAPGDHQTANARALERAGAAIVVADSECNGVTLDERLSELLVDEPRLATMEQAAKRLAIPDAADRVAALVEKHARPV